MSDDDSPPSPVLPAPRRDANTGGGTKDRGSCAGSHLESVTPARLLLLHLPRRQLLQVSSTFDVARCLVG